MKLKHAQNETREMYKNLIKPKVDKLANAKGRGKIDNILNTLENIKSSIFDGYYYRYFDNRKFKKRKKHKQ